MPFFFWECFSCEMYLLLSIDADHEGAEMGDIHGRKSQYNAINFARERRRRSEFIKEPMETFAQLKRRTEQQRVHRQVCDQTFMCWMTGKVGLQMFEL